MESFRAFRIHQQDRGVRAGFEELTLDDLTAGEVVIKTAYSGVNYKDALAATGKGKILRRPALNGGIDLAGHVVRSDDPRLVEGEAVTVCGANLSETFDGGYAEYARVPAEGVVKLPASLSPFEAMAIGTAGFTAALAMLKLEDNDQQPELGPMLVTGATGGVGSLAVDLLAGQGFEVTALTGKDDRDDYLRTLGATEILHRRDLELSTRPLDKAVWGGAVDNLGGETLAWLTRVVRPFGNIASIGLASGIKLETTVMPFILRGVSLLGINSVLCSPALRERAWERLGADLKPRHLEQIVTREIGFDALPGIFDGYIAGEVTGRTVVRIGAE